MLAHHFAANSIRASLAPYSFCQPMQGQHYSKCGQFFRKSGQFFRQPTKETGLDVEVLYVEGVVFDELAALLDVFAHQGGEDLLCFDEIFELDL